MAKKSKVESKRKVVGGDVSAATKRQPTLRPELLEELLAVAGGPAGLTGKDGLLRQLTGARQKSCVTE